MTQLLVKPDNSSARRLDITAENAGWEYVGFQCIKLAEGETYSGNSEDKEVCIVLVGGKANVDAGDQQFDNIGERMSPFDGIPPYAVYLPPKTEYTITATTELEVGVCSSEQAKGEFPIRLITPSDCVVMDRGEGSNLRRIHNIMMGETTAERLLITEVFTPSGNWSSYPPHKHDVDNLPEESYLEETYYHRLNPPQGFAFQRVYTSDRSLDESMAVSDGDCVLVPKGYHPVGVPHGYDSYYLNTMAGPSREWVFYNDPEHEWIFEQQK